MLSVFFIGSGRLARNLAHSFQGKEIEIAGVYSRTKQHGEIFSQSFETTFFADLGSIPGNCDIYFIAVSDQAVEEVSEKIAVNGLVVHCSGMLSIEALKKQGHKGVFWPVQSLSKNHFADFEQVPICIESNDESDQRLLEVLADKISRKVFSVSGTERNKLHLAAVFVNNFNNHIFTLVKNYLDENQLSFEILKPLIEETGNKILSIDPMAAQTGPAIRKDLITIENHKKMLEAYPGLLQIYDLFTTSIMNTKA